MKLFNKKAYTIFMAVFIAALFPLSPARGTIASVVVTPANPTTLSNGLSYYLAGMTYSFAVNVVDPDISGWAQLSNVQITIPNTTNIVLSIDPSGTGTDLAVAVTSGTVDAVADVTGTYNNCTVTFKVTFRWDTPESTYTAGRTVSTICTTSYPASNSTNVTNIISYGVCSSMTILDFAQNGVASDGMVNPYHDPFTVSGVPVYNVPGATTADAIETRDPGEITSAFLFLNGVTTGLSDTTPVSLSFTVPTGTVTAFGSNSLRVRAIMTTAGGPESSNNNLSLDCDEVEITGISFVNGGGIDTPAYYRSVNIPGTELKVTARMKNSTSAMIGNTTVRIYNYTDTTQYIDVIIPNGSTSGTALVPIPVSGTGLPGNPGTIQNFYRAEIISGGSYGGDTTDGQNVYSRITQPGAVSIYWDNGYYPWATATPFTTWVGVSSTAYSFTFQWTPLALNPPDQDFYSYRVYYKEAADTLFYIIDKNTAGYSSLGDCTTGTVTIQGLSPVTNYDYYITAVDVFGQEVPLTQSLPGSPIAGVNTIGTLASTIRVEITDGITTYIDSTFTMPSATDNPADRTLRQSAVNVKVFIVGMTELPDIVNIIVANNTAGNLVNASGVINPALVENTDYYRMSTLKIGTNTWSGYIPTTNPLITTGTSVKFIIETVKNSVSSYADNNSESETPTTADPNDYPFTFYIGTPANFQPWPTRVLNNVIDSKNPVAYPAYYLSDDAYVTIKIYDIKGRPVKTLLDHSYRKGGENIKEGGWQGDNKSRKKVGVGLYYMHFSAERTTDGKVILDSYQKVVMAR